MPDFPEDRLRQWLLNYDLAPVEIVVDKEVCEINGNINAYVQLRNVDQTLHWASIGWWDQADQRWL